MFEFKKYNNKPIFDIKPLIKPKISLKNDFKEVGKNILTKLVLTPSLREISLEYYVRNLSLVRDFESFFIDTCKGRLNSFYIPSFKKDFEVIDFQINTNFFKAKRQNSNFGLYNQNIYIYVPNNNFASKILSVDVNIENNNEFEVFELNDFFNFMIDKETYISELLNVRFKSDTFDVKKNNNIGYKINLDFQEVKE